jgi:hypothetical protein
MNAIELIAAERQRQIDVEGWVEAHDDEHDGGQLAKAAACYALAAGGVPHSSGFRGGAFLFWPWDWRHWKPTPSDRIRELTKAGALIVAEIERLQRCNS